MTAAGWTLALLGAFLVLCGAAVKTGNGPSLRAVAEELARIPESLQRVVQADTTAHMLLGIGLLMLGGALVVFMVGSLLA